MVLPSLHQWPQLLLNPTYFLSHLSPGTRAFFLSRQSTSSFLPQGLCISTSLCQEHLAPYILHGWFPPQCECHLLRRDTSSWTSLSDPTLSHCPVLSCTNVFSRSDKIVFMVHRFHLLVWGLGSLFKNCVLKSGWVLL